MQMAIIVLVLIIVALLMWAGPQKSTHEPGPDESAGKLLIAAGVLIVIAVVTAVIIYG
jgi:hypothetical protein